jgi:parvulin-like peptidyl-prolyl isomerase
MVKLTLGLSAAGLVLLLLGIGSVTAASNPDEEQIVARVNRVAITKGDVRTHLEMYERAHPGLPSGKARETRATVALQALMDNVLRGQVAREMGISISDEEVEAAVKEQQGKTDDASFAVMLAVAGSNPAKLRYDIRKGLLEMKVRKRLMEAVVVTQNDLKAQFEQEKYVLFPEQVKARQIIVLTPDLADRLYRQLKEGADFAKLAESASTDPSRTKGGDLGWVTPGSHYVPWDDVVFKLKPGEISQPFHSLHGYHIVLVEEHRAVGWGRPEDQRDRLEELIRAIRSNKEYDRRIEEARKRATIWIADRIDLDGPVASPATGR